MRDAEPSNKGQIKCIHYSIAGIVSHLSHAHITAAEYRRRQEYFAHVENGDRFVLICVTKNWYRENKWEFVESYVMKRFASYANKQNKKEEFYSREMRKKYSALKREWTLNWNLGKWIILLNYINNQLWIIYDMMNSDLFEATFHLLGTRFRYLFPIWESLCLFVVFSYI